ALAGKIVLIVGGVDKGFEWQPLKAKLDKVKALVIVGQLTQKIQAAISGYSGKILTGAQTMHEIVGQAVSLAEAGDFVLLSPGASSFDMFKNATDRAEQFVAEVGKL